MDVAQRPRPLTQPTPRLRRLAISLGAAIPLLTIFAWLCLLYGWEAWGNAAPWLVTDEFERAQLSRAIATTGHAARRTVPHSFDTLYVYLIAPAWWIHNTSRAYGLVKTIGVATMTSVLFPTYLLARTLVSKRWALFAAAGAAMIPALAYSSLLLEEPLAYPWAALCFYTLARALVTKRPAWILAAAGACVLAPLVRDQLVVIIAGAVVAAAAFWFTGAGGARLRRGWTTWDWVGFVVLGVVCVSVFDVYVAHRSNEWYLATQYYKGRMLRYGLWAAGALTIGLGVLPTIAGLVALVKSRGEALTRERRAFVCVAVPMIAAIAFYTAVKAAYVSTLGLTYLTERNLVYIAPLLFVGTAMVFERRKAPLVAILAATAFALYLVTTTPYKMEFHFFFDAPGLSVLQSLNRVVALTPSGAKMLLVVLALASGAVLIFVTRSRWARMTLVLAVAAGFVLVWNAYGEITGARSSHAYANQLLGGMPRPLDWIDRAVPHGAQVYYLGQSVNTSDPNGVVQLEFWNRSLLHVWSTDATAPGPGPSVTPDVIRTDGLLRPHEGIEYMVTDNGISVVGKVIAQKIHTGAGAPLPWTLYKVAQPLRVRQTVEGIYSDGWSQPVSAMNQYSIANDTPSYLSVHVSRVGGGRSLPATVRIRVGRLALGTVPPRNHQPMLGKILVTKTLRVRQDLDHTFVMPAPKPPFRVETSVTPFSPHDLDATSGDRRELGAQVDYKLVPRALGPQPLRGNEETGVYPDGWIGSDSTYTQWSTPDEKPGVMVVGVSRKLWGGPGPAGNVTLSVSTLGYDRQLNVVPKRVVSRQRWTVHNGDERTFRLKTPAPPFRVDVHVGPTFVPHKLVSSFADTRQLGAQVQYGFEPR